MRRASLAAIVVLLGAPAIAASAPSKRPRGSSSPPAASAPSKRPPPKLRKGKRPTKPSPPPSPPAPPPAHIPHPIEMARVHVEVAADRVLVTSELRLTRGEWEKGDLRVHVAYGAPGVPLAFEAWLCAVSDPADCTSLPHATSYRAPSDAAFVIGPAIMAGETVELASSALEAAFGDEGKALLRLRQLRPLPAAGASDIRELLIRLGEARGVPYPLGSVEVRGVDGSAPSFAEARFCGVDVEPREILVLGSPTTGGGIPPKLARRDGHEDLCVRFSM